MTDRPQIYSKRGPADSHAHTPPSGFSLRLTAAQRRAQAQRRPHLWQVLSPGSGVDRAGSDRERCCESGRCGCSTGAAWRRCTCWARSSGPMCTGEPSLRLTPSLTPRLCTRTAWLQYPIGTAIRDPQKSRELPDRPRSPEVLQDTQTQPQHHPHPSLRTHPLSQTPHAWVTSAHTSSLSRPLGFLPPAPPD